MVATGSGRPLTGGGNGILVIYMAEKEREREGGNGRKSASVVCIHVQVFLGRNIGCYKYTKEKVQTSVHSGSMVANVVYRW